jgi:hypothetical protein
MDKVFFFIQLILFFVISCNCGTISEYIYSELLTWSYFESVHRLAGNFSVLMSCVLNNSMAFVLALNVFWQFNVVDLAKGLKELANLLLRQGRKGTCKATHIDSVVLLATCT